MKKFKPSTSLRAQIKSRAGGRCEYCKILDLGQIAVFHCEHIRPLSVGGSNDADNLAFACPRCNARKLDKTTINDLVTGRPIPMFHPRLMSWEEHFERKGFSIIGKTDIGRAMVQYFDFNSELRLGIRMHEMIRGITSSQPESGDDAVA